MPNSLFHRVAIGVPPMHTWPRPAKYAVMGAGIAVCLAAYGAAFVGLTSLATTFLRTR